MCTESVDVLKDERKYAQKIAAYVRGALLELQDFQDANDVLRNFEECGDALYYAYECFEEAQSIWDVMNSERESRKEV